MWTRGRLPRYGRCLTILTALAAVGLSGCAEWDAQPEYGEFRRSQAGAAAGGVARQVPAEVTVKRGDTVYGIARSYGVPMRQLIEMNRLAPPYTLYVGQRLRMPAQQVYVVQPGDSLYGISRTHAVDMNALARTNRLGPPYVLQPGQRLVLPGVVQAIAEERSEPDPKPTQLAEARPDSLPPPVAPATDPSAAQAPGQTPAETGASPTGTDPAPAASSTGAAATTNTAPPPAAAVTPPAAPATASPAVTAPAAPTPVGEPPPRAGGRFVWPVKGPVLAGFGPAGPGLHNDGINIAVPVGTSVKAAENGVVVYAGNELKGFGNLLLLKHDGGWMTAYAHNSELLVPRGATVKKGDVIARSGATGNVDRPQVHFELRKGSKAVDPTKYLDGSPSASLQSLDETGAPQLAAR